MSVPRRLRYQQVIATARWAGVTDDQIAQTIGRFFEQRNETPSISQLNRALATHLLPRPMEAP